MHKLKSDQRRTVRSAAWSQCVYFRMVEIFISPSINASACAFSLSPRVFSTLLGCGIQKHPLYSLRCVCVCRCVSFILGVTHGLARGFLFFGWKVLSSAAPQFSCQKADITAKIFPLSKQMHRCHGQGATDFLLIARLSPGASGTPLVNFFASRICFCCSMTRLASLKGSRLASHRRGCIACTPRRSMIPPVTEWEVKANEVQQGFYCGVSINCIWNVENVFQRKYTSLIIGAFESRIQLTGRS